MPNENTTPDETSPLLVGSRHSSGLSEDGNQGKKKINEIVDLLKRTQFTVNGGGVLVDGKRYPKSAARILKKLTALGENLSAEEYQSIFKEVTQELRGKTQATKGRFFNLGAREQKTADVYQEILTIMQGGNMSTFLPDDVLRHIASFLDVKDVHNTRVDRRLRGIFSKEIPHATLLKWVVYGQPEKAAEIWGQHPDYLLKKGTVETPSGRRYENASPLLVALFEGDTDMWHRMLGVTIDAAGNITGRNYPVGISEKQVLDVFLEYEARKAIDAYDFSPLITALQTYVDNFALWTYEQSVDHWCRVVGGAQLRAPVHVKQEYCHPTRAFHPVPSFNGCLPRLTKLYNGIDILIPGSGLGLHFGLIRAGRVAGTGRGWRTVGFAARHDLTAITALRDTRNSNPGKFIEFVKQLGLVNQNRMIA